MTKGELIKALDGLDDNARIYVDYREMGFDYLIGILDVTDKVVGNDVENEITLIVGDR